MGSKRDNAAFWQNRNLLHTQPQLFFGAERETHTGQRFCRFVPILDDSLFLPRHRTLRRREHLPLQPQKTCGKNTHMNKRISVNLY